MILATDKINMTKMPQLAIKEGSVAEYVCETNCSFPDPPIILWFIDNEPVDASGLDYSLSNDTQGNMTMSMLNLTAKREVNNKTVKCENNNTIMSQHNLEVLCKYLMMHMGS